MKKFFPARFLSLGLYFVFALVFKGLSPAYAQDSFALSDSYKFNLGVSYEFVSDKSKANKMDIWYSESGYAGASMQGTPMFMVFDLKSMKMVSLMESQKTAMVMDINKMKQHIPQDTKNTKVTVVKTGKTETVAGYSCEQYKITDEKTESYTWITKELGTGYGEYAKNLAIFTSSGSENPSNTSDYKDLPNGVMLKMESTDLATKKKSTMVATEVHKTAKTVSAAGFKVMNMPGK